MKREIKFRGKQKDGRWRYGSLIDCICFRSVLDVSTASGVPLDYFGSEVVLCKVDDNTIGQNTGFKDKKGQEIYEGDILQNVPRSVTYIAKWSEAGYWKADALSALHHDVLRNICDSFVVIGNIYDNKELLED